MTTPKWSKKQLMLVTSCNILITVWSKNIKTGRSWYGVSMEHIQGASLAGGRRENEQTVQSFIRSLDGVTERT